MMFHEFLFIILSVIHTRNRTKHQEPCIVSMTVVAATDPLLSVTKPENKDDTKPPIFTAATTIATAVLIVHKSLICERHVEL